MEADENFWTTSLLAASCTKSWFTGDKQVAGINSGINSEEVTLGIEHNPSIISINFAPSLWISQSKHQGISLKFCTSFFLY